MKSLLKLHYGAALGEHLTSGVTTFQELLNLAPLIKKADALLKSRSELKLEGSGWLLLPHKKDKKINDLAARFSSMTDVIQIGIGGSALGNMMLHNALLPAYWNEMSPTLHRPRFYMADNVDPQENRAIWDRVDPRHTALIVVSKSGTTAETMANFLFFWEEMKQTVGAEQAARQTIIITDPEKGVLSEFAKERGCAVLPVPPNVGGRYSVLSPVGLLSAAVLGADTDSLLEGARKIADFLTAEHDMEENPAWVFAAISWLHFIRKRNMIVFMPYIDSLSMLSEWFAQLWGESLGKEGKGSTPIKALGTIDQHSQLQLYTEGPDDKLFLLLHVSSLKEDIVIPHAEEKSLASLSYLFGQSMNMLRYSEQLSTASSLVKAGRPVLWLEIPELNAFYLGALIYLLEYATALTGFIMDINPFDQPGVELGKEYTFALMGRSGFEVQAQEVARFSKNLSSRTITVSIEEK